MAETSITKDPRWKTLSGYFEHPDVQQWLVASAKPGTSIKLAHVRALLMSDMKADRKLLECTPGSVFNALGIAASLDLEIGSGLGLAYLVPFRDTESGKLICTLIISYRGLMLLAYRAGLADFNAMNVYSEETFAWDWESGGLKTHVPKPPDKRGKHVASYARAVLKPGVVHYDIMWASEIDDIRKRALAKRGPWVTDPAEMWRKTVSRRCCKYLPLTAEMQRGIAVDEAGSEGKALLDEELPSVLATNGTDPFEPENIKDAEGPDANYEVDAEALVKLRADIRTIATTLTREQCLAVQKKCGMESLSVIDDMGDEAALRLVLEAHRRAAAPKEKTKVKVETAAVKGTDHLIDENA